MPATGTPVDARLELEAAPLAAAGCTAFTTPPGPTGRWACAAATAALGELPCAGLLHELIDAGLHGWPGE